MPYIRVHHTATTDDSWDGSANEARLRDEASAKYYRRSFAWYDDEADLETKSAYKFVHHAVSSTGKVGAANTKAASSGIGVLNGGRSGTTIPRKDREGVYRHLAAHLKDAGDTPPDLK
jgi:Escherichia/Staphylococcus phage prohead protease